MRKGKTKKEKTHFPGVTAIEWELIFAQESVTHLFPSHATLHPSHYKNGAGHFCKLRAFSTPKTPKWGQSLGMKYSHIQRRTTNNWVKTLCSGLTILTPAPHLFGLYSKTRGGRGAIGSCRCRKAVLIVRVLLSPSSPFLLLAEEEEDAVSIHWSQATKAWKNHLLGYRHPGYTVLPSTAGGCGIRAATGEQVAGGVSGRHGFTPGEFSLTGAQDHFLPRACWRQDDDRVVCTVSIVTRECCGMTGKKMDAALSPSQSQGVRKEWRTLVVPMAP